MSGTSYIEKNSPALVDESRVLAEDVRREYLTAMGIQVWYDPEIKLPNIEVQVEIENQPVTSSERQRIEKTIEAEIESPAAVVTEVSSSSLTKPAEVLLEKAIEHKSQTVLAQQNTPSITDSASLALLNTAIDQCQMCELHTTRRHAISGEGNAAADLMIVISAPVKEQASDEDVLFCQSHKEFLQRMLRAIDIDLASVYLTSLVKCQPPEQRKPYISEMICCDDHLSNQIKLIQPKVIMVLGESASQQLLVSQKTLTDLRLRHHQHLGVPVYASYHPAEIIDSTETKRKVWQDLLQIKNQLNKPVEV